MNALILLNPNAASGRAVARFRQIEPLLREQLGDFRLAVTARPEELAAPLQRAAEAGCDTVLSVGGDGTTQALLDALAQQPALDFTVGVLPFGTGRDWARTLGIPLEPAAALRWLARAEARRVDLGCARVDGRERRFLNVASAGLSGEVGNRVNRTRVKRPWTFLQSIVGTLLRFDAPPMRVFLDGERFYEGDAFVLSVGNGRYFGRGMMICPDALINDGLFDVVLVEGMGKPQVLAALPTLFRGTHIHRADVHTRRARHVRVEALHPPLGLDLDGEPSEGTQIEFEVLPGALRMLVDPTVAALQ